MANSKMYQSNMFLLRQELINQIFNKLKLVEIPLNLLSSSNISNLSSDEIYEQFEPLISWWFGGTICDTDTDTSKIIAAINSEVTEKRIASCRSLKKRMWISSVIENSKVLAKGRSVIQTLSDDKIERIVLASLKGLFTSLDELLQKERYIGDSDIYEIYRAYTLSVEKNFDDYYLVVAPHHKLYSKYTIYDLFSKNILAIDLDLFKEKLLEGEYKITTFRRDVSRRSAFKVVKIIEYGKDEYWKWVSRIQEYYKNKPSVKWSIPKNANPKYLFVMLVENKKKRNELIPYHSTNSVLLTFLTADTQKIIMNKKTYIKHLTEAQKILESNNIITYEKTPRTYLHNGRVCLIQESLKRDSILVRVKSNEGELILPYYKVMGNLFDWALFDNAPMFYPYRIPEYLMKRKIKLILVVPESVEKKVGNVRRNSWITRDIFEEELPFHLETIEQFPQIEGYTHYIPIDSFSNSMSLETLATDIEDEYSDGDRDFLFAITIVPPMSNRLFRYMKQQFLKRNIFHQAIHIDSLALSEEQYKKQRLRSVLSQIFHKMGIYYYSLDMTFRQKEDYIDFVMGFDITKRHDESGRIYGIAGSAVIQNSEGHITKVIPVKTPQSGSDIGDFRRILRNTISSLNRELRQLRKSRGDNPIRFWILKDGQIWKKELEQLTEIAQEYSKYNFEFIISNIKKRIPVRFFREKDNIIEDPYRNTYFKLGTGYYITAHYYNGSALKAPIKTDKKFIVTEKGWKQEPITKTDIHRLILMTKLNYAQPEWSDKMKLPAPVHYSHKFVKAVWYEIEPANLRLLEEGFLPFI